MGLFDFGKKKTAQEELNSKTPQTAQVSASSGKGNATVKVEMVFNIRGVGVIPTGTVTAGVLKPGMRCTVNGKTGVVKTIEKQREQLPQAISGDKIGFTLSGNIEKQDLPNGTELSFQ